MTENHFKDFLKEKKSNDEGLISKSVSVPVEIKEQEEEKKQLSPNLIKSPSYLKKTTLKTEHQSSN